MPTLMLVGGGSSSGKTYLTRAAISLIDSDEIALLTLDDYYKDQTDVPMEERLLVNYDHPRAFDWKLMRTQLKALKEGKPIQKPVYDFVHHTRSDKIEIIEPKNLIVVEGIMALVDKTVRELGDVSVFIQASAERRFLRRLVRDVKERGRTFDNIVKQYFATVQPMYDEIVEPSSMYADLIINNDGVKNLGVDVLRLAMERQLSKDDGDALEKRSMSEEFADFDFSGMIKGDK